MNRYQKGKTNLDFTEARDSEWQWHQLGHMQVCTSLQTDNHSSTPPLSFLQAGCPSCHPTNSVKALKATKYVATLPCNLSHRYSRLCDVTSPMYIIIIIFLNLGRSSRGGRQKLIQEIIALMVNHPSGSHQQSSRAARVALKRGIRTEIRWNR